MNEILFVTGNEGKVSTANIILKDFKIRLKQRDLELPEKQATSVEEIARDKAEEAFERVKEPLLVNDGGFFVKSLNGFPGHYTKFVLETIGLEGLLKLMEEERGGYFKNVLVYIDKNGAKLFTKKEKGVLTREPKPVNNSKGWSDLWRVYRPKGSNKTLSELSEKEYREYEKDRRRESNFRDFGEWFKKKRS